MSNHDERPSSETGIKLRESSRDRLDQKKKCSQAEAAKSAQHPSSAACSSSNVLNDSEASPPKRKRCVKHLRTWADDLDMMRARRPSRSPILSDHSKLLSAGRSDEVGNFFYDIEHEVYCKTRPDERRNWGYIPSGLVHPTEKKRGLQNSVSTASRWRSDSQIIRDIEDRLSHDPLSLDPSDRHRRHVPLVQRHSASRRLTLGAMALKTIAQARAWSLVTSLRASKPGQQSEVPGGSLLAKGRAQKMWIC